MAITEKRGYYKQVGNKTYGPYWYPRETHHWTEKDVARIAKHVSVQKGTSAIRVLAYVLIGLGLSVYICRLARAIRSFLSVWTFIKEIAVILATSQLITVLIQNLTKVQVRAPGRLKIIIALVIAALWLIKSMFEYFETIISDYQMLIDSASFVDDVCDELRRIANIPIDRFCDATGDTCELAKEKLSEATEEFKKQYEAVTGLDFPESDDDKSITDWWWLLMI
jgi:hypothetical protein